MSAGCRAQQGTDVLPRGGITGFCGSERISRGRLEQSSLGNRSAVAGHDLCTDSTGVSGAKPLMFGLSRATYPAMCSRSPQRARASFQVEHCRVVASTAAPAQVREAQHLDSAGRKPPPDKHGCCAKRSCRHVLPWHTLRRLCALLSHSHAPAQTGSLSIA